MRETAGASSGVTIGDAVVVATGAATGGATGAATGVATGRSVGGGGADTTGMEKGAVVAPDASRSDADEDRF